MMKARLSVCLLLLATVTTGTTNVPADFRARIVYQTPEEWKIRVMSSHLDSLKDALPDSPLIGATPRSIFATSKIVVSVSQPETLGTRLPEELIYSAIHDYTLTAPGPTKAFDIASDRWIEVTGSENQEYRIILSSGIPSEVFLRQDKDTLVRFGLKKKEPNKAAQTIPGSSAPLHV